MSIQWLFDIENRKQNPLKIHTSSLFAEGLPKIVRRLRRRTGIVAALHRKISVLSKKLPI
jgi:hypothetical protein